MAPRTIAVMTEAATNLTKSRLARIFGCIGVIAFGIVLLFTSLVTVLGFGFFAEGYGLANEVVHSADQADRCTNQCGFSPASEVAVDPITQQCKPAQCTSELGSHSRKSTP